MRPAARTARSSVPVTLPRHPPTRANAEEYLLPFVEEQVHNLNYPWPEYTSPEQAIPQVSRGILQQLFRTLPLEIWKLPSGQLDREIASRIDPESVGQGA